jgi:diguanylate cyclase (GGDEF)-like protein/PAS domain S-box-containing protein
MIVKLWSLVPHAERVAQTMRTIVSALYHPRPAIVVGIAALLTVLAALSLVQQYSGTGSHLPLGNYLLLVATTTLAAWLTWRERSTRKRANILASQHQTLRESEDRYRALVQNASYVSLIMDASGQIRYQSPLATTLWGYAAGSLQGQAWQILVHPDDVSNVELLLSQISDCPGVKMSLEARIRFADGTWHTCDVVINDLLADPSIDGILVTAYDISERKQFEEHLTRLAYHDPLSRLPNRALFLAGVKHALERTTQIDKHIALLFLDLDNFKLINDSLGHPVGDQLLVAVSERLQVSVRPSDTVARLGGDEFTVLIEDLVDVAQAVHVAERILDQLRAPFVIDGHKVFTTGSIGIAFSSHSQTPDELLRNADLAMYQAKTSGKAGYAIFDHSLGERMRDRLLLENDLRRALELDQIQVYYQPVVNLANNTISEVEALARWMHPERGVIAPTEFVPIAEETGLILPIGQWILEQACRQAVAWHEQYPADPPLIMAVNLSPRQFQEPEVVTMVARTLEMTGLAPHCLKLEITEGMMMQDSAVTTSVLRDLKALGVELAIDDFGTGYCSLNYLKRFPVDTLKIDRSFINGLGKNAEDTAIVRAVIAFAKALNLSVTGEGVETAHQVAELSALDCERGQGFFFGRPLPREELDAWLSESHSAPDRPALVAASHTDPSYNQPLPDRDHVSA